MPVHKSAEKRVKQNKKRYRRNMAYRTRLKKAVRSFKSIDKPDEAKERFPELVSIIDKSRQKGIIKKRKASRMKSRLSRYKSPS